MKDNKKVLGILGGMGPLASQLFYKKIIDRTYANCDQDHINMIILNHASMMDRTQAIMCGATDKLLEQLESDLDMLQYGGADYCVITCNTCHVLLNEMRAYTGIEIVSMTDAIAEYLMQEHGTGTSVGIMATDGTVSMGIYHDACDKYGLVPVDVCEDSQHKVMSIIYDSIKKGKPADLDIFSSIERELRDAGCERIILGCTELSCVKADQGLSDFFVDPMDVLAEKIIKLCNGKLR